MKAAKKRLELDELQRTAAAGQVAPDELLQQITSDVALNPSTLARVKTWLLSEDAREIAKAVLILLAAGAFVSLAIVAPTGAGGLAQLLKPFVHSRQRRSRIVQRFTYQQLYQAKLQKDGAIVFRLTQRGQALALRAHTEALLLARPKQWDKQWRLILFDVPEKDRGGRDFLRRKLVELGFMQIQKSAWLLPWPCEAEFQLFRERFDLLEEIKIFTISDSPEFDSIRHRYFPKTGKRLYLD
jgi:hypothetical protein